MIRLKMEKKDYLNICQVKVTIDNHGDEFGDVKLYKNSGIVVLEIKGMNKGKHIVTHISKCKIIAEDPI